MDSTSKLLLLAPPSQIVAAYKELKTIKPDADLLPAVEQWNKESFTSTDKGIILSSHSHISTGIKNQK
jgi:hypothetical protein